MAKTGLNLGVLAGRYKSQILKSPHSPASHPMGAREKNALFNMLQPYLSGARVLDLFAGSGALGVEALSRGAAEVTFVEKSPQIARTLQENLTKLGLKMAPRGTQRPLAASESAQGYQCQIWIEDALRTVQRSSYEAQFDLILADPPYEQFETPEVQAALEQLHRLLAKDGVVALSFPAKLATPQLTGLNLISDRQYAGAGIGVYTNQ